MRISTTAFCAAAFLVGPALAQNSAPGGGSSPPVNGVVQFFDGKTIAVKTNDGTIVNASLAPNALLIYTVKKTLADIKPGDFIASGGTRGPDGIIRANEIRILNGVRGEGQYPMAQPNQVMTNATVKQVMTNATVQQVGSASGTPVIKLTFHGDGAPGSANCTGHALATPGGGCVGETQFEVLANVAVTAQMTADPSMFKAGTKVTVTMAKAADGTSSVTRVTITE